MSVEIKVPSLGESVVEATVAKWYKNLGDNVTTDEPLLELETDKVTLEVPAPCTGILDNLIAKEGETVEVGTILGKISEGDAKNENDKAPVQEKKKDNTDTSSKIKDEEKTVIEKDRPKTTSIDPVILNTPYISNVEKLSPSVRKIITENNIDPSLVETSRSDGRITKSDLINHKNNPQSNESKVLLNKNQIRQESIPMSRLRQTIAKRLKDAQNNAAILTTFNEVDMSQLIETRNEHKENFESKYGVKLGFMSFFVKACITALKEIPDVNAEIQDNNIIYKNFYNIGVAVGTEQGLVVPVLQDADQKSVVDIEREIFELGTKARAGKLSIADMQDGTFTISNGGVYGSLMSTPILNPPQSGVLGMHKIEKRPIVINDEIKIRPMMYLALSYDHRIIDGKAAVTFLVRVKEGLEDPRRILLGV